MSAQEQPQGRGNSPEARRIRAYITEIPAQAHAYVYPVRNPDRAEILVESSPTPARAEINIYVIRRIPPLEERLNRGDHPEEVKKDAGKLLRREFRYENCGIDQIDYLAYIPTGRRRRGRQTGA